MIGKFISFVKTTIADIKGILTSKENIKSLYGVSLYRNAIYLTINSATNAVGGFLFWIIAAKLYSTESIGLASAAIAAIGLLSSISNMGLNYGLIRFLPSSEDKASEMVNSSLILSGIFAGVLALVFLAGLTLWSPALLPLRAHPLFMIAFVVITIAQNLYGIVQAVFIAMRRTGFDLSLSLIDNLLAFVPLAPLMIFTTMGIFVSWGIGPFVVAIVAIIIFIPKVISDYRGLLIIKKRSINPILKYSLVNFLSNQLQNAPNFIIPLMVVNLLGAKQNAYFYIGWIMGTTIFAIPGSIANSLFAEGANKEEELNTQIKRSLKFLLILLIPVVIIILLIADKFLLLFGTAYSQNSAVLLRILVISGIPGSINYIYYAIKRVQKKMKSVIIMTGFIGIATLVSSYLLLPSMGINAVGIAWLGSQSIVALWIGINYISANPAIKKR